MDATVKLPDSVLFDVVKATIIKELSQAEGLVEAAVREMLNTKAETYSKKTVFQSMAEEMVKKVAREIFSGWLEENREKIRTSLLRKLAKEEKFFDTVADKLVDGLGNSMSVSIKLDT